MTRISNSTSISIVAQNPSYLATQAASMSVGSWRQISPINQSAVLGLGNPLDSGTITPFGNSCVYNPINDTIVIVGADHATTTPPGNPYDYQSMYVDEYRLSDNTFYVLNGNVNSTPGTGAGPGHIYDHLTVDPITGDCYVVWYNGQSLNIKVTKRTYPSNTFTTQLPLALAQSAVATYGSCWWSGTFTSPAVPLSSYFSGGGTTGSHGAMVVFNGYINPGDSPPTSGVLSFWDPTLNAGTGGWLWCSTGVLPGHGLGAGNYYNTVCKYSAVRNCIVYGGGGLGNQMWRLSATGVVTKMPNFPGRDVGIQSGNFVCDPVSGNFLVFGNSQLWELNTAGNGGAGAWTLQTGARDPAVNAPGLLDPGGLATESVISCAMPNHGVVAYIWQQKGGAMTSGQGRFYLYKHA